MLHRFDGAEEAWQILRTGPEPLTSQFSVSYGLVLNLLSVATLDQAKQFVSRSFGNFQATEVMTEGSTELRNMALQRAMEHAEARGSWDSLC